MNDARLKQEETRSLKFSIAEIFYDNQTHPLTAMTCLQALWYDTFMLYLDCTHEEKIEKMRDYFKYQLENIDKIVTKKEYPNVRH